MVCVWFQFLILMLIISFIFLSFRMKEPCSAAKFIGQNMFNFVSRPTKSEYFTVDVSNIDFRFMSRNKLANVLVNQQKTICIPFGLTFAN